MGGRPALEGPGHGQIAGHSQVRAVSWGGMLACMVLIGLVFAAGYRITDMRYARTDDTSGWTVGAQAPADRFIARADWRSYGGTHANDRFSALDQITPDNVARLEKVWSFSTGDMPKPGEKSAAANSASRRPRSRWMIRCICAHRTAT
ncbi:hypothetical protein ACFQ4K_02120 [Tistrella bauzanensis]